MAYATSDDMVARFGTTEMIRLSTPFGQDMVAVVEDPIDTALDDASSVIDSYLRRRYAVPLVAAPPEIRRACQLLARYDLYQGEQKSPTEQVTRDRDETLVWLRAVSRGEVVLDLREMLSADESTAMTSAPPVGADNAALTRGGAALDDAFGGCSTGSGCTQVVTDASFWGNS
jgi:phage gp36-like protein